MRDVPWRFVFQRGGVLTFPIGYIIIYYKIYILQIYFKYIIFILIYIYIYMLIFVFPPSPPPLWDGFYILTPYKFFFLFPLWCGGGVVCYVGYVWCVWLV